MISIHIILLQHLPITFFIFIFRIIIVASSSRHCRVSERRRAHGVFTFLRLLLALWVFKKLLLGETPTLLHDDEEEDDDGDGDGDVDEHEHEHEHGGGYDDPYS